MKKINAGLLLLSLLASAPVFADKGGIPHEGSNGNGRPQPSASVPEPGSVALVVTGVVGLIWARRRFK